eukprot:4228621-Karenia_brevis.AAC.1
MPHSHMPPQGGLADIYIRVCIRLPEAIPSTIPGLGGLCIGKSSSNKGLSNKSSSNNKNNMNN